MGLAGFNLRRREQAKKEKEAKIDYNSLTLNDLKQIAREKNINNYLNVIGLFMVYGSTGSFAFGLVQGDLFESINKHLTAYFNGMHEQLDTGIVVEHGVEKSDEDNELGPIIETANADKILEEFEKERKKQEDND